MTAYSPPPHSLRLRVLVPIIAIWLALVSAGLGALTWHCGCTRATIAELA